MMVGHGLEALPTFDGGHVLVGPEESGRIPIVPKIQSSSIRAQSSNGFADRKRSKLSHLSFKYLVPPCLTSLEGMFGISEREVKKGCPWG